jgi:Cu-Zn family superoxide dismutase
MEEIVALLTLALVSTAAAAAETRSVTVHELTDSGIGKELGSIEISSYREGTLFKPQFSGLEPGPHGFHVHANADCGPKDGKAGGAAGGHFDPENTGAHEGPYGEGHLGDLPALYADDSGKVSHPVYAPRISPAQVKGHALIVHKGGDNYSDEPEKLGGGGDRMACAVVK